MNKTKFLKTALAVLFVISMIFSTFSATAINLGGTDKLSTRYLSGYNYKDVTAPNALDGKYHNYFGQMSVKALRGTGETVFCINPGKSVSGGDTISAKNPDTYAYWNTLPQYAQDGITRALIYFNTTNAFAHLPPGAVYGQKINFDQAYAVTQIIIWEYLAGFRKSPTDNCKDKGFYKQIIDSTNPLGYRELRIAAYDELLSLMANHRTVPSFSYAQANQSKANRKTLTYNPSSGRNQITLTDTNGQLAKFAVSSPSNQVTVAQSGNTLTISAEPGADLNAVSVKLDKVFKQASSTMLIIDPGSNKQECITGALSDPVTAYNDFDLAAATLRIIKTTIGNDGKVDGFEFKVTEKVSGKLIGTYTSGATGIIDIPNLTADVEYLVEEINIPADFVAPAVNPVSAIPRAGQTATVGFQNVKNPKAALQIIKTSEDDIVDGVEFEVKGEGMTFTGTTANGGYLYVPDLKVGGVYTITEINMPWWYVDVAPRTITLKEGLNSVEFWNRPITGRGNFFKYNSDTDTVVLNASAKFAVYEWNKDSNDWDYLQMCYWSVIRLHMTTGNLTITDKNEGKFKVIEQIAPDDHVLPENPYTVEFTITKGNTDPWIGNAPSPEDGTENAVLYNDIQKGQITLAKSGDTLVGFEVEESEYGDIKHPVYDGEIVAGAVYEVRAAEDIYVNKVLVTPAGTLVDTLTTLDTGAVISKPLFLGRYTVNEIDAPTGLLIDETVYEVELTEDEQTIPVVTSQLEVSDERQKAKLNIKKSCELPSPVPAGFNPYAEVVFGVYAGQEFKHGEDIVYSIGDLLGLATFDSEGNSITDIDLPFGDFFAEELATAPNYKLNTTRFNFSIVSPDDTTEVVNININGGNAIINNLQRGGLKIIKTFEGLDTPIANVPFRVTGTDVFGNPYNETFETDANGVIEIADLVPGIYKVIELESELTENYVLSAEQTVTVAADDIAVLTIENLLKKIELTVSKVDSVKGAAQGDATLEGAVYGLYLDDELVKEYTTDDKGKFVTDLIPCGDNYTIREISPSKGYKLDDTVYTIPTDGELYTIEISKVPLTVKEVVIDGTIEIIKTKGYENDNKPEENAVFRIWLKSAESYATANEWERDELTTDAEGKAISKRLPFGEYNIEQISGDINFKLAVGFSLKIDGEHTAHSIELLNAPEPVEVIITKTDITGEKTLPGAEIVIKDSDGKTVYTDITAENGQITPIELLPGKYTFEETLAPSGYARNTSVMSFTVNFDGTVTGSTTIKDELTKYIFKKTTENGAALAGVTFTMYDKDGNEVMKAISDADGLVTFEGFAYGKYTIKETVTVAGYEISTEVITIEVDGKWVNKSEPQKTIVNKLTPVPDEPELEVTPDVPTVEQTGTPQTGDNTPIKALSVLFVLSLAAVGFISTRKNARGENK